MCRGLLFCRREGKLRLLGALEGRHKRKWKVCLSRYCRDIFAKFSTQLSAPYSAYCCCAGFSVSG